MATVRPNLLGYALAMFDPVNVICSTGFAIISPHRPEDANFIYQSLYSSQIQQQINEMITGSNYPAINSAEVKKLRLLIPQQEDERYSIGEVLSTVDNEIQTLSSYRQKLVLQKKGLMQRLLTGQVRVGVAAGSDPKISG
jgi:type I restriction enzyme S subunit